MRKPIPGFPAYEVSSDGSVWSCLKKRGRRYEVSNEWRKLRIHTTRSGHALIGLRANGTTKHMQVHRLVLEAFVGPCPDGMECLHSNGNPSDNSLENLRWGTHKENHEDMARHGTLLTGEKVHTNKLKMAQVREIKSRRSAGERCCDLAREFGVHQSTVSMIARGVNWAKALAKGVS